MEVLEEEELRIMKIQQKEYEEIRNSELIEAQRLEAGELRRKQELERRKMQQGARKEERKAGHKKHVARIMAKKYLLGIRENALRALKDQGLLVEPIDKVMHEDVVPWMLDKMMDFLKDEDFIANNVDEVIVDAFKMGKAMHE